MTIKRTVDEGEQQEISEKEVELTPEMELALGRVLLPVFAGYLQKMGLLEAAEEPKTAKKWSRGDMTLEEAVDRLAGAQLGHEFRLSRIEEGFQQISGAIEQLTRMLGATDERLDGLEEGQIHTDARLDALIDSQIQLTRRVDALTDRFDKVTEVIATLTRAQERMDELIQPQLERNGAAKPRRKATKMARKKATKKS